MAKGVICYLGSVIQITGCLPAKIQSPIACVGKAIVSDDPSHI